MVPSNERRDGLRNSHAEEEKRAEAKDDADAMIARIRALRAKSEASSSRRPSNGGDNAVPLLNGLKNRVTQGQCGFLFVLPTPRVSHLLSAVCGASLFLKSK